MENNLAIWNKLKTVSPQALKTIKNGRLKGFTDINPQFRYQAMTEQFGPCGVGWKFTMDEKWTEPGPYEQVFVSVKISLFVKIDGEWSTAIPGIGGSKLVSKEKAGLYANDEGYKMALTDALSVAMKMLGVASDVYAGLWDGAKYRPVKGEASSPAKGSPSSNDLPSAAEVRIMDLYKVDRSFQELRAHGEDEGNKKIIISLPTEVQERIRQAYLDRLNEISSKDLSDCFDLLDSASASSSELKECWQSMQNSLSKMSPVVQHKVKEHFEALGTNADIPF